MMLMLNLQSQRRIMNAAILVVVVADRAIQHVIAENHIESFGASGLGAGGVGDHLETCPRLMSASAYQFAIHLDQAGITRLNWAHQRGVIANVRNVYLPEN